jgi:hypothetical protein
MMMSNGSMRNPSALWWIVPITALLLFWMLNLAMPLNADDFSHRVFFEDGKPRIITSFIHLITQKDFFSHYAPLVNIYYSFSLNFLPEWLNDFIVTLWVGILIFLLLRIALRRKVQPTGFDMTLWLGILSVLFLPLQAVENFISYTCGLYAYIPGGVGTLLVLDKISRWFIEGEDDAPAWWLYPVSFVSGASNGVYGFFMVPLFGLLVFWLVAIEKKPFRTLPSWVFYLMFSFTAGFGFLVFAPGTHARISVQDDYGSFYTLFIMSAFLYASFALLTAPFCVGVVLMLLLFMRKEDLISRREKFFFPLLLLSTAGIVPAAAFAGFLPYGRALWATHLVLGIILAWAASRLMTHRVWLVTFPVTVGALALFGTLIWNTYIVRTEFERIEQAFLEAGKRGDQVLLVDFPALRKEPHPTIMRLLNRVVLVQRDPKHWLNRGLVKYYNARYGGKEGFQGPAYIVLDNLVPPHLHRYAFDTKNDPLNQYPEIRSLIEQQKTGNASGGGR